jgi:hypothetical protein
MKARKKSVLPECQAERLKAGKIESNPSCKIASRQSCQPVILHE